MNLCSRKMKKLIALVCLGMTDLAMAQASAKIQDLSEIQRVASQFLQGQAAQHDGKVNITLGKIDPRLQLPACDNPSPFLLLGSKPWGKISLGIRCVTPKAWTIYVAAQVQIMGDYYVAATSLAQGQIVGAADISKVSGDVSALPAGTITNPAQVLGKSVSASLSSGTILRMETLKSSAVIQQGQSVRVVSGGPGFQVATDALALSNAVEGQIVRAKTASGQFLSGIAKAGGVIEISY